MTKKIKVNKQEIISQVMEGYCDNRMTPSEIAFLFDTLVAESTDKELEEIISEIDTGDFRLNIVNKWFEEMDDEEFMDFVYELIDERNLIPDMLDMLGGNE